MKKVTAGIPTHKMSDRTSAGISVKYIDGSIIDTSPHLTMAHRDDHYIFLFQQQGSSSFMVDFKDASMTGPAIVCILPGQVHCYRSSHQVSGYYLAIDTMLVGEQYRRVFEEDVLQLGPIVMDAVAAGHLERCMQSLYLIMKDDAPDVTRSVSGHLAAAVTGLFAEQYTRTEGRHQDADARTTIVTRAFRTLLKQYYKTDKSPASYACRLNLSLSYLNECVKHTTGMPVSHWIQHEIILEAKRLLYHSTWSVKEIAHDLGFDDATYFSRLFTKNVRMAPGQFRRHYHE